MDLQELLVAARRRPFILFRLTLTEGSQYDVKHPEFCMVGKRSVILGLHPLEEEQEPFDHSVTLDLLHIVKMEPLEWSGRPKSNGSK
jgi:hypothetical protein